MIESLTAVSEQTASEDVTADIRADTACHLKISYLPSRMPISLYSNLNSVCCHYVFIMRHMNHTCKVLSIS